MWRLWPYACQTVVWISKSLCTWLFRPRYTFHSGVSVHNIWALSSCQIQGQCFSCPQGWWYVLWSSVSQSHGITENAEMEGTHQDSVEAWSDCYPHPKQQWNIILCDGAVTGVSILFSPRNIFCVGSWNFRFFLSHRISLSPAFWCGWDGVVASIPGIRWYGVCSGRDIHLRQHPQCFTFTSPAGSALWGCPSLESGWPSRRD